MENTELYKRIEKKALEVLKNYLNNKSFTEKKVTDTPNDALSVVNRKYVTLNGTSAQRPTSSVIGQPYLDMTLAAGRGKPVWWNGTGFIDATGTYV